MGWRLDEVWLDTDLLWFGEGALVEQCRRKIEVKTFHPVRELEMALLRSDGYEIAHARAGEALLNFAVAGPAVHSAA